LPKIKLNLNKTNKDNCTLLILLFFIFIFFKFTYKQLFCIDLVRNATIRCVLSLFKGLFIDYKIIKPLYFIFKYLILMSIFIFVLVFLFVGTLVAI